MSKFWHDLGWLLSGGIEKTIRERNQLRVHAANLATLLEAAQQNEKVLAEKLRRALPQQPLPFIMLNTLPKSGSVFLSQSLHRGLNIPMRRISAGYALTDLADWLHLSEAAQGNAIAKTHLDACPTNLRLLAEYSPRIVLHLRDPRQALLSWVHYMQSYAARGRLLEPQVTPQPPAALFNESLSAQVDWHLAHHFANLLDWIERWLAHIESKASPTVLVTQFQEMREDAQATVMRILDFYGIPRWLYTPPALPRTPDTHFRKGELEEWRKVFNPTQQKITNEMMAARPSVQKMYGDLPAAKESAASLAAKTTDAQAQGPALCCPPKAPRQSGAQLR